MQTLAAIPRQTTVVAARPEGSLRSDAAWMSAGMAVYSACQWAMVAVLAKLGTVEMVGVYALGVATSTPVLMLAQLNLRAVLTTDARGTYDFRDYRDLRLTTLSVAMVVIAILGARAGEFAVVLLAGMAQAVEWTSDTYQGLMQREEVHRRAALSLMLRAVLGLCALAAGVAFTGSLVVGLSGVLVARLAILIFYDATFATAGLVPTAARRWTNRMRAQAELLRLALPLGIVLVLGSLTLNVPRYFIAESLGNRELGIFSALASLATAGNLFVNALGQAVTPRLARLYTAGDAAGFRGLTGRLLAAGGTLGVAAVAVAAIAGGPLLALAYRAEYAEHASLLVLLMAAAGIGFLASVLGYAITAGRRFREQIPLQVAVLAASSLAAWLLVPGHGLKGAAAAVACGSAVQVAGEAVILAIALRSIRTTGSAS